MVSRHRPAAEFPSEDVSAGPAPERTSRPGRPQTHARPSREAAELLREAMTQQGLKVVDVAAALHVSERSVTGWRAADRGPSPDEARRLADLLDRPEVPTWWTWPDAAATPAPRAAPDPAGPAAAVPPTRGPQADAPVADLRPARRPRRSWARALLVVAAVALVVAVTAFVVRATTGTSPSADRGTGTAPSSAGPTPRPVDTGPETSIASPSCDTREPLPAGVGTVQETQGSLGAPTFTNPADVCGAGPKVPAHTTVQVVCRLYAPQIPSTNPDGYWYLIADGPYAGRFAAANTFLNGDAPGAGSITNTDVAVPRCVTS